MKKIAFILCIALSTMCFFACSDAAVTSVIGPDGEGQGAQSLAEKPGDLQTPAQVALEEDFLLFENIDFFGFFEEDEPVEESLITDAYGFELMAEQGGDALTRYQAEISGDFGHTLDGVAVASFNDGKLAGVSYNYDIYGHIGEGDVLAIYSLTLEAMMDRYGNTYTMTNHLHEGSDSESSIVEEDVELTEELILAYRERMENDGHASMHQTVFDEPTGKRPTLLLTAQPEESKLMLSVARPFDINDELLQEEGQPESYEFAALSNENKYPAITLDEIIASPDTEMFSGDTYATYTIPMEILGRQGQLYAESEFTLYEGEVLHTIGYEVLGASPKEAQDTCSLFFELLNHMEGVFGRVGEMWLDGSYELMEEEALSALEGGYYAVFESVWYEDGYDCVVQLIIDEEVALTHVAYYFVG